MNEHDAPSSFIKTPQQLIVIVLLGFIVPVIGIVLIVQLVVSRPKADPAAMAPAAVAARIAPVGKLEVAAAAAAPAGAAADKPADGKGLYTASCAMCHATGVANAPKLGDKAAWAPRIKTGMDSLVKDVLSGKGAMPPKGGAASASVAEIRAAVEYLVSQSK